MPSTRRLARAGIGALGYEIPDPGAGPARRWGVTELVLAVLLPPGR